MQIIQLQKRFINRTEVRHFPIVMRTVTITGFPMCLRKRGFTGGKWKLPEIISATQKYHLK